MNRYSDLSVSHVDTCLSCFVLDHCNGDNEVLLGVPLHYGMRVHEVRASLHEAFEFEDKVPHEFNKLTFGIALDPVFAGKHPFKAFARLDKPSQDDENGETCYAWFRVTWTDAGEEPGHDAAVSEAFAELDAAETTLAGITAKKARAFDQNRWNAAFDAREAASDRAKALDPVRFVRRFPGRAYANRHLLPPDMVARIEAAETDAEMVQAVAEQTDLSQPTPCQQPQAQDMRGASRPQSVPGDLIAAYRHHRAFARCNSYRTAVDAIQWARGDVANGKTRYASADTVRPFALDDAQAAYRAASPTRGRWIERPGDVGLRWVGWSDELYNAGRNNHRGWFTDDTQETVMRGCVYQLPSRKGETVFVPAYGDPNNTSADNGGAAFVYFDELDFGPRHGDGGNQDEHKRDCALIADSRAQSAAESERDYNEAWQAGTRVQDIGEEYTAARRTALAASRALKAGASFDPAGEARRSILSDFLSERCAMFAKRDELERAFLNSNGYRDAFA